MSPIIDDLRIEAEIPPTALRPGTAVVIKLRFLNLATRARTLHLIGDESFRFGQSTFYLHVSPLATVVQPPRRGSYVPSAADFHEIAPRGVLESVQTLRLPRDIKPGKYSVEWAYENHVECWPTSPNIPAAGQSIPGIWVGRIVDSFVLPVARSLVVRP